MAFLIAGLGNPGEKYERTRHNFGFLVVEHFAAKMGWTFKRMWRLKGKVASGENEGKKVYLLKPSTYMNLSGDAVKKCLEYYKVPLEQCLIVLDDVYLKFGTFKIRSEGSSGGHNGLKSIEEALGSQEFARLRIGIGGEKLPEKKLETYVLENFDAQEEKKLPEIIENGALILSAWLTKGIASAAHVAGQLSKETL